VGFWWGNLQEREHLEDIDRRIILKCTKKKWMGECG
jgi:hypothetical protein